MPNGGIESDGVLLEVPDVGLHSIHEHLFIPRDVLEGPDFVPVEVAEGQPRNELLDEIVVHQEAASLPALLDHLVDKAAVDARLIGFKEMVMEPVSHIVDLSGSLMHS